jgi:hypothetical protein
VLAGAAGAVAQVAVREQLDATGGHLASSGSPARHCHQ